MSELNDLIGVEAYPISLDDMVKGTSLGTIDPPKSAIRNRAATVALTSEPDKALENYQIMMAESENGDSSYTQALQDRVVNTVQEQDQKTLMNILADPAVPYEQKKQAISQLKLNPALKETSAIMHNNLASQTSEGERPDEEDARINATSKALNEINQERTQRQALINSHMANLKGAGVETVGEMAALWVMPFGNNIAVARERAGAGGTAGEIFKAFALPGSDVMSRRQKLENLPPAAREEMTRNILTNLKDSSGVLMSDNDFQEWQRAQQLLDEGGYSNTDVWLDNLSGLLDVVGLGFTVRSVKGVAKAGKAVKSVEETVPVVNKTSYEQPTVQPVVNKPVGIQGDDLATVTGKPTAGAYDKRISDLEAEKAQLLGKASNTLDKGEVANLKSEREALVANFKSEGSKSDIAKRLQEANKITSKEAKKQAESIFTNLENDLNAKIGRIDEQLTTNKEASTVIQRVAEIEKQIATLKKNNTEMFIKKSPVADMVERINLNSPLGQSHPLSPHSTIKQSNPEKARDSFKAIFEGDEAVAEGVANSTKQDALAQDVFPKAVTDSGKVAAEPVDIQRSIRQGMIPERAYEFMSKIGRIDFTPMEKAAIRGNIVNDFQSAKGLVLHESMGGFNTSFKADGGSVKISAVYGKPEGAWSNAQDAVSQATYALSKYGILPEEVKILKNDGLDYVPVKLEDVKDVPGSYMIRIESEHKFTTGDVVDPTNPVRFEGITTKLNFLDRLPFSFKLQGGISSYLADAASRIDPKITRAQTAAQDYSAKLEKILLDEAAKYSDQYVKLPKEAQKRVDEYLFEANIKGMKMDMADMKLTRGMSDEEIDAVKSFRDFWDGQFYLENADVIRQYNEQGYMLFRNASDEFHVKPMAKNSNLYNQNNLYDPAIGQVRLFTRQEIDELYDKGGAINQYRRPVQIGQDTVTHMVIRNTPSEYARKFRDSDMVLNYREGYFTVHYDKPRFIDKTFTDANGVKITKAVAVGKDSVEAESYVKRANHNATSGEVYSHRADDRMLRRGSDEWFDIESARGRIAQRYRGKALEVATGNNLLGGMEIVESPVTSAMKSAKSIAGQAITRPVIETGKARVMQQFGHLFKSDGMGGRIWPRSISEIGEKGGQVIKEVADARTNWAYLHHLENGYINGMDEFYKQFMYAMAEKSGELGLGKIQRGFGEAARVSPTGGMKQAVFTATIAANPIRQAMVQMHQAVRTFAYNPISWANGNIISLPAEFLTYVVDGRPRAAYNKSSFVRFIEDSGVMDAVDKQNLVRSTLIDAAEARSLPTKAASKTFEVMRKIGFDQGEKGNMLMHMAAVYDKYVRNGANVDSADVKAAMMSEARAISYEMNFAGDMPYNQTSSAFFLQFLQVPHKAFLQSFNRKLTGVERARLLAGDVILWGPPVLMVNALAEKVFGTDILPENKTAREILTEGMEAYSLNTMFRDLTGKEDIHIDFSSLAPYDYMGWAEMLHSFYTGGLQKMMMSSPAGQLLFSEQGRVRNAMGSAMRFMGVAKPVGETPDSFMHALNEIAKISSGWNNAYKAHLMLETYKRFDAYGKPTGDMEHAVEAFAQVLGFGGMSQKQLFEMSKKVSDTKKNHEDEVKSAFKDTLRYYQSSWEKGATDLDQLNAVAQFMLSKYEYDSEAQKIIQRELGFVIQDPDQQILTRIIKSSNIPGIEDTISKIKLGPFSEDDKQRAIRVLEDAKKYRQEKEVK
jgi:hypothetical protein